MVMSLLGPGSIFGEICAFDDVSRSADVVALTPLRLARLRISPFSSLLSQNASFALSLARLQSSRLCDLNRRFVLQTADATTRLLDALVYLARTNSSNDNPLDPLPVLPQMEIAVIAGLSRETASRTMSKLRNRGVVVEEDGQLRLSDIKILRKRGLIS